MLKIFYAILALTMVSCSAAKKYSRLQNELDAYVIGKDARFGIAVIFDGKDTVQVNGNRDFPMLSVYKFPQSIQSSTVSAIDFSHFWG